MESRTDQKKFAQRGNRGPLPMFFLLSLVDLQPPTDPRTSWTWRDPGMLAPLAAGVISFGGMTRWDFGAALWRA